MKYPVLLVLCTCSSVFPVLVSCQNAVLSAGERYGDADSLIVHKPASEKCIAQTGVSAAAILRFIDAEPADNDGEDPKLKCYMDCLFRTLDLTDTKGEVHLGKLMETIKPEFESVQLRMGSRCTKPKGKDLCERAFWFHKCWKMADPVHYHVIWHEAKKTNNE
ncbi:general odorant-binding protein 83a-like [Anopheles bellator]|uniref:general odorant-binding protein 83a-like n=1 Tax=Anopheles bellator TaxID=139047 RepID=UPI002648C551|nr:general odorant-binding protein 83a-like [Anopheles bellator]